MIDFQELVNKWIEERVAFETKISKLQDDIADRRRLNEIFFREETASLRAKLIELENKYGLLLSQRDFLVKENDRLMDLLHDNKIDPFGAEEIEE
jgi:hypothetical protein